MAFGFQRSRPQRREGVPVTAAQVAAAKLIIERAETSNKPVDDAVVAIANAEQVPGTSQFQVVRFIPGAATGSLARGRAAGPAAAGPVAPAGGAAAR